MAVVQKRSKFSPFPFDLCSFDLEIEYLQKSAPKI